MPSFTIAEAAELANVKPTMLKLWLETGQFKPKIVGKSSNIMLGSETVYAFTEQDIPRLVSFAKSQQPAQPKAAEPSKAFVDDGVQENFTVAEIAALWKLSTDSIQRLFQDEPGVVVLGDKNPRGKRRRVTLRIPRTVMERVKRSRSNSK
jgi:hypothetical protein